MSAAEIWDSWRAPRGIARSPPHPPAPLRTSGSHPPAGSRARRTASAAASPAAVRSAATIRSPVVSGHCAGSSASASTGARPCARRGVGADAPHPRPCPLVLDPCLSGGVPDPPAPTILELVAHEGDDMLEGDPRLLEARGDDHGLPARHHQQAVQRRRRDPRQERRLAVTPEPRTAQQTGRRARRLREQTVAATAGR